MTTTNTAAKTESTGLRNTKESSIGTNKMGALVGGAAAVALEAFSKSGSTASAVVAGVCAGLAYNMIEEDLEMLPQDKRIATAAGFTTFYAGFLGGRITAAYFPGNEEE